MIERIAAFCMRRRALVAGLIACLTLVLSWFALHIEVRTVFEDMLPSRHEYVQTHQKFKDTFGGSNSSRWTRATSSTWRCWRKSAP
jgi:predicted RND superfamily exporter protein